MGLGFRVPGIGFRVSAFAFFFFFWGGGVLALRGDQSSGEVSARSPSSWTPQLSEGLGFRVDDAPGVESAS